MNKLNTEREMDISVMEAQAMADELYEAWKVEFVGRRAVVDLARRKKAKIPQPVAGLQPAAALPPAPPSPLGGSY